MCGTVRAVLLELLHRRRRAGLPGGLDGLCAAKAALTGPRQHRKQVSAMLGVADCLASQNRDVAVMTAVLPLPRPRVTVVPSGTTVSDS